jgi:hypothetical protein
MNTERMKILEMLKEGRINAEEADRLLEKLAQLDHDEVNDDDVVIDADFGSAVASAVKKAKAGVRRIASTITVGRHSGRVLAIYVTTHEGKNVNVRLPLSLVRAGVKLTALLPQSAADALKEKGVNLDAMAEMDSDELLEALHDLNINITTEEGDTVTICCE